MSVEIMTEVSHFLFAASGISALFAVLLFFWYDIPKCFRMVSGRLPVRGRKLRSINKGEPEREMPDSPRTEVLTGREETFLLDGGSEETLALDGGSEETLAIDWSWKGRRHPGACCQISRSRPEKSMDKSS